MAIELRSRSLLVSYLQIYLRERFGLVFQKSPDSTSSDVKYEIKSVEDFPVSSIYDVKTYSSLSLFMAMYHPEEGFPLYWYRYKADNGEYYWRSKTITEFAAEYTVEDSNGNLIKSPKEVMEVFEEVMVNNLNYLQENHSIAAVPDRVMSYIFDEVVYGIDQYDSEGQWVGRTQSPYDEVLRIQKYLYQPYIEPSRAGHYDSEMKDKVSRIQKEFLDQYKNGGLPAQYEGFKVTGHVDPWTERVIKEVTVSE